MDGAGWAKEFTLQEKLRPAKNVFAHIKIEFPIP
jgi:hypothetical protein